MTQGVDTSNLVISSLRALELVQKDDLSKNVFKASVRAGEARIDTYCLFERFVDQVRDTLELGEDEYFSDED